MPQEFRPISVVAVGYPGDPGDLDEETRAKDARPRTRKPAGEIAFRGRWGEPFRGTLPAGPAKLFESDIPLRFSDIDAMGHVNNAVALTLFEPRDGRVFCEAEMVQVMYEYGKGRVKPVSNEFLAKVREYVGG